jgi:hypothetical protein
MKYRKLRIAWSVAWGVIAVLLCVLWMRSYWWTDRIEYVETWETTRVESSVGKTSFIQFHYDVAMLGDSACRITADRVAASDDEPDPAFEFHWMEFDSDIRVTIPTWLLVSLFAALAVLPWLRFRFSLRTLLIVTMLVAVVLGLIVWLAAK